MKVLGPQSALQDIASVAPHAAKYLTAAYSFTLADHGCMVMVDSTSPVALNFPTTLPDGFFVRVWQFNTGQVSFTAPGRGVRSNATRTSTFMRSDVATCVCTNGGSMLALLFDDVNPTQTLSNTSAFSGTTAASIALVSTGQPIVLEPNSVYEVNYRITYRATATTQSLKMGFADLTSDTVVQLEGRVGQTNVSGTTPKRLTDVVLPTGISIAGASSVANVDIMATLSGRILTGATKQTLVPQLGGAGSSGTTSVAVGAASLSVMKVGGTPTTIAAVVLRDIGMLGDSRAYLSYTEPYQQNTYKRSVGMAGAIASATVGVFDLPPALITGQAGYTTQQIRDLLLVPHIQKLQAAGCNRTFLIGSFNDRPNPRQAGVPTSTSQANLLYIIDQLNQAGIYVELISETPAGNPASDYELTDQGKADHKFMHDWMQSLAGTNAMLAVHDWWSVWLDPASGSNYYPYAGYTADYLHAAAIGAMAGAPVSAASLLARITNLTSVLPTDNTLYNASTAPKGSLTANPMMTGTGGTKDSTASMVSGTVPTGWTLSAENMDGYSGTIGLETVNGVSYVKLALSGKGTATGGNPLLTLKQDLFPTQMSNGDKLKVVSSIITQGDNIANAGAGLVLVPLYQVKYDTENSMPSLAYPTANSGPRSRETPVYLVDGTQSQYEMRLESFLVPLSTVVGATFWWGPTKTFKA